MEIAGNIAAASLGFIVGYLGGIRMMKKSRDIDRLADPKPFAVELYSPIVEVEISHPFRSAVQLTTFPNMTIACSFLAEWFTAGGFSQIVLTAIDEPDKPADVPDWWEAEKSAVEHAIEREHVPVSEYVHAHEFSADSHGYCETR